MLLFYLVLSLGVSFLCSLFEAVILSVTPGFAASVAKDGKRGNSLLLHLRNNIDDSLSAILTLNTIAHTIGAAGVGAEVLKHFGDSAVAIGSAILTLLVLVLSEIIPKTIGASYWRTLAQPVAYGIRTFIWITYPFVKSFKLISRLIGGPEYATVTASELAHTAELGKQEGALTEKEGNVIKNILRLRSIRVKDIMTPRTVVFALSNQLSLAEVMENHSPIRFSRIPVFEGDIDHVVGMVTRFDILDNYAKGEERKPLGSISSPIHGIPITMATSDLLDEFIARGAHMFAVYDEHGGLSGVVTLEDAIETLLGSEIVDESDVVADMRVLAQQKWAQRRKLLLDSNQSSENS